MMWTVSRPAMESAMVSATVSATVEQSQWRWMEVLKWKLNQNTNTPVDMSGGIKPCKHHLYNFKSPCSEGLLIERSWKRRRSRPQPALVTTEELWTCLMDTTAAMVIKDQQNLPPPPSKYDIIKSFLSSLNVNIAESLWRKIKLWC